MSLELRILSGARAGQRERFAKPVVSVGRDPRCDLRFDPGADLDVSARHAELRVRDGRVVVRDLGSTNGTFVNGVRADEERELRDGDELSFGSVGPRATVHVLPARGDTEARVARAVDARTAPLRRALVAVVALLAVGTAGAYALGRRDSGEREARIEALLLRNDSLAAAHAADLRRLAGRVVGLDSALAATETERVALRRQLEAERARAGESGIDALDRRLARSARRQAGLDEALQLDYAAIAARGTPAVALVVVEMDDTTRWTGSAFAVGPAGRLVTNRHLVADAQGRRPRRIAAIFSDTRVWRPARLVRIDERDDLALLALDGSAPGVAPLAAAPSTGVGAPVAILGYPLGLDTPMEGTGTGMTAKATLGVGVISKSTAEVLQIDAFAGEGSSGSPVLDAAGRVVGVVFGGARESGGRIVYAVPGDRLARFVADDLAGAPR